MNAADRPYVPPLRCPNCGDTDRTTLCHLCGALKLPRYVRPFASELQEVERATVVVS